MKYLFLLFLSITLVCSLAFADYRTPDRVIPIYKTPAAPVIDGEVDSLWTDVQAYGVTLPDPNGKESMPVMSKSCGMMTKFMSW